MFEIASRASAMMAERRIRGLEGKEETVKGRLISKKRYVGTDGTVVGKRTKDSSPFNFKRLGGYEICKLEIEVEGTGEVFGGVFYVNREISSYFEAGMSGEFYITNSVYIELVMLEPSGVGLCPSILRRNGDRGVSALHIGSAISGMLMGLVFFPTEKVSEFMGDNASGLQVVVPFFCGCWLISHWLKRARLIEYRKRLKSKGIEVSGKKLNRKGKVAAVERSKH